MTRTLLSTGVLLLAATLAACGGGDETLDTRTSPTEGDIGTSDAPSSADSPFAEPATEIELCEIQNGLPVAEVKVTNTTEQEGAFAVEVQFLSGNTVLGTGLEFTQTLSPGQNQTIRMGNMQGDADAVDKCEVIEVSAG